MKKGCKPKYHSPRYWKKPDCKWGERNPNRKLTWEKIGEIRARYKPYKVTNAMLAREYGVNESLIRSIRKGIYWTMDNRRTA